MNKIYKRIRSLLLTGVLLMTGLMPTAPISSRAAEPADSVGSDKMEVHFIDVGQGDSTLIICGEHSMLIDAGDESKAARICSYLQMQGIQKLDYLILTHPDDDHIGGAPAVIAGFAMDRVFMSDYEKDDETYQKLIRALNDKHLNYSTPEVGTQYTLGPAVVTILAPGKAYDNANNASIVLTIQNGSNRFLFTGDACEEAERDILSSGIDISADVYQVGHHGSKDASSREFVKAVNPAYAVISCGDDNIFGLPHAEVLNTFKIYGVCVYRTDEDGTIVAVSDGRDILFLRAASQAGMSACIFGGCRRAYLPFEEEQISPGEGAIPVSSASSLLNHSPHHTR